VPLEQEVESHQKDNNKILGNTEYENPIVPCTKLADLPSTYSDLRVRSNLNNRGDGPIHGPPKTLRPVLIPTLTKKPYHLLPATELPGPFKPNELPPVYQPPVYLPVRSDVEKLNRDTNDAKPPARALTPPKVEPGEIRPPPLPWQYHHRERRSARAEARLVEIISHVARDVSDSGIRSDVEEIKPVFSLISRPTSSLKPIKRPLYDPAPLPRLQYDKQ
jgi:hypothetical protein